MAVMCSTGCARRTCITLGLVILTAAYGGGASTTSSPLTCDPTVGTYYEAKGYSRSQMPEQPLTGPICGENSCCGPALEAKLTTDGRQNLDKYLRSTITRITSILDTRAKRFDDFFKELMVKSKRDFHEMFKKTYGLIYLQNSEVFADLFAELERYYGTGQVSLSNTIDRFFNILYLRMFTVINSQYEYDKEYLACVEKYMNDLKPFGDVPHKLSIQLRRSFVATRTLHKTLSMGAAAANNMLEMNTTEECAGEITRLQHCGRCKNSQGPGPCSSYCIHTLQNCLQHFSALSAHWDNFADAVDKVGDRLLGPFNIEMVVEPINIKISEAIMNFQESGTSISEKIFTGCGKPSLERRRRRRSSAAADKRKPSSGNGEFDYDPLNFGGARRKHKGNKDDGVTTLEKIIRDIKQKIKETRQFWRHLPYQYCNEDEVSAGPSQEGNCWNGSGLGNYSVTGGAPMPPPSAPPLLQEVQNTLHVLTSTLQGAHQGQEVELQEQVEETTIASGSGSGGGFVDQEGGDDDDDDGGGDDDDGDDIEEPEAPHTTTKQPKPLPTSRMAPPTPDHHHPVAPTGSSAYPDFTRAIIHYVLPIVLVWFGGTISDLL